MLSARTQRTRGAMHEIPCARLLVRLVLCALWAEFAGGSAPPMGRQECPCIVADAPDMIAAQEILQSQQYPAGYGLGCKAHDDGLERRSASQTYVDASCNLPKDQRPYFCGAVWCYVDADKCPEDKKRCEAAGGVLGSDLSPYCRTVAHSASTYVNMPMPFSYSYATCGFQDKYNDNFLSLAIAGRHIKAKAAPAAAATSDIWVYAAELVGIEQKPERRAIWKGLEGIVLDVTESLMNNPDPPLNITVDPSWASPESRAEYPKSSFTACCLDVIVGKTDVCMGDFWITPQRLSMGVDFMYPYDTDKMMLIAPDGTEPPTIWALMGKPFQVQ